MSKQNWEFVFKSDSGADVYKHKTEPFLAYEFQDPETDELYYEICTDRGKDLPGGFVDTLGAAEDLISDFKEVA